MIPTEENYYSVVNNTVALGPVFSLSKKNENHFKEGEMGCNPPKKISWE